MKRPRKPCRHSRLRCCARCLAQRERSVAWDRAHPGEARERKRRYDQSPRGRRLSARWWRRWISKPENRRLHNDRRRLCTLRARGVDVARQAPTLEGVWKVARGRCWLCGRDVAFPGYHDKGDPESAASIDHFVPVSKGGTHHWKNCRLAHQGCNRRRGADDVPRARVG